MQTGFFGVLGNTLYCMYIMGFKGYMTVFVFIDYSLNKLLIGLNMLFFGSFFLCQERLIFWGEGYSQFILLSAMRCARPMEKMSFTGLGLAMEFKPYRNNFATSRPRY